MNLITRLDFDGLVSAAMITDIENVQAINFSDPQTIEEGGLLDMIAPGDAIAHLPFHPDVGLWFHNHDVSHLDQARLARVRGKWGVAPSTARHVFEFYGPDKLRRYEPLVQVADRVGSANLTQDDVLNPKGWVLVSYTLDPRFSEDYAYGMEILNAIKGGKSAEDVLKLPTVARRVELYQQDEAAFREVLDKYTRLDGNVIVTDFRGLDRIPRGNRFYVFTKYPQGNVHIRLDPASGFRVKVSASRSIFNRTSKVHIGRVMEEYGGGGPEGAGTCYVGRKVQDERIPEIIQKLKG